MPMEGLHGRAIGADRLQPGDHAFLGYADDDARWEILGVFTQQGLARGEKVWLLVDVAHSPAEVAVRVTGGETAARRALGDGRLVVSNTPRFARGAFDAARLVEGARRRLDTVLAEGFSGLWCGSEMSLALEPLDHLGQALEYEAALHASLFDGQPKPQYTALCCWDERLFGGTDAMEAVRRLHPVGLLPRPGDLHAAVSAGGLSITGDSDLATRESFDAALRALACQPSTTLVLDITDLSFFDTYSANAVLRLASGLPAPQRLEVHCRSAQRRLLHLLGSRAVRQLSIITMRL